MNFIKDCRYSAISVALVIDGRAELGVVYNPYADELFFELRLSPWDYAAGGLVVEEAGGTVATAEGDPIVYDRPVSILAHGSGLDTRDAVRLLAEA